MITVLSGGTGTPKLLRGLRRRLDDAELAVVVNTGEDCWVSGGHLSPDVDTVLYLCAGLLNEQTWWGITGDTFACHEALRSLGEEEVVRIGDRDRAVQLLRGELLRRGRTLTQATETLAERLGIGVRVLPMADEPYATHVLTDDGTAPLPGVVGPAPGRGRAARHRVGALRAAARDAGGDRGAPGRPTPSCSGRRTRSRRSARSSPAAVSARPSAMPS